MNRASAVVLGHNSPQGRPPQRPRPDSHTMAALAQPKPRASLETIERLFEVRETKTGRGLFACQPIARGTALFSEDDWIDETEARAFSVLASAQIDKLSPALRSA